MATATTTESYEPRLRRHYREQVAPSLRERFKYSNVMQIPRLLKVAINMGVGEGSRDAKVLQKAEEDLALIAGQKPKRTRARISVSAFKLREGMPVGCCVTLRGRAMYEFLERLIVVAIPRIRDFRGLPARAFDGRGNYTFGIKEHQIFLELDFTKEITPFGMDVTFVTTAEDDEACRALLKGLGLPVRDPEAKN
jgi:large subunit ribosomal protein L5